MKCPICKDIKLITKEKEGIEIDYCPECKGVWLEKGELDKIIERSLNHVTHEQKEDYFENINSKKKHKKENFLTDIFDMFGGD